MKKIIKAIALTAGLFVFSACEQPADETKTPAKVIEDSVSGGAATLDKSKISIYMTVTPYTDNATGKTGYEAWCQISDYVNKKTYNNAVVKINDVTIPRLSYMDSYYKLSNIGTYATGDSIVFTLEDETLGKIYLTETIPASLSNFTTTPAMPASGAANTQLSYSVSWTAVPGADVYEYWSRYYESSSNSNTSQNGGGSGDDTDKINSTVSVRKYDSATSTYSPYPWIGLSVCTRNIKAIPSFKTESEFRVNGVTRIFKHN